LSTTVLQGSVAMRVNYSKIFNDFFIADLLLSVMVKEFWRSVSIRQSYGKKSSGTFFPDTVYVTGTLTNLNELSGCPIYVEDLIFCWWTFSPHLS